MIISSRVSQSLTKKTKYQERAYIHNITHDSLSKQPISNHPSKTNAPSPAGQQGKAPPQNAPQARVELVYMQHRSATMSVHYQEVRKRRKKKKKKKGKGKGYFAVSANIYPICPISANHPYIHARYPILILRLPSRLNRISSIRLRLRYDIFHFPHTYIIHFASSAFRFYPSSTVHNNLAHNSYVPTLPIQNLL